jgi:hypothetical protein
MSKSSLSSSVYEFGIPKFKRIFITKCFSEEVRILGAYIGSGTN